MVLSLIVMRSAESFAGNVRLLMLAISVAALVPLVAAWIVTLPWRQRASASVAFGLSLLVLFGLVSQHALVQVARYFLMECSCEWWNLVCCLI